VKKYLKKIVSTDKINEWLKKSKYKLEITHPFLNKYPEFKMPMRFFYIFSHVILFEKKDFFFIQVGAMDGQLADPLHNFIKTFDLNGIVIEPIPHNYEKLCKFYSGFDGIKTLNVALHSTEKTAPIYMVDPKADYPYLIQAASSLDKNHVMCDIDKINGSYDDIISVDVKCNDLKEIVEANNVKKIDLLQIDAEGYDFEIVKMIDFDKMKPTIIRYENERITVKESRECLELLASHGYLINYGYDTTAYLKSHMEKTCF